jgi:hypothetical protein
MEPLTRSVHAKTQEIAIGGFGDSIAVPAQERLNPHLLVRESSRWSFELKQACGSK